MGIQNNSNSQGSTIMPIITHNEAQLAALDFISKTSQLINENKWDELYNALYMEYYPIIICKFTNIILDSGINPLNYLNYIPRYYLGGDQKLDHFIVPEGIVKIKESAFDTCRNLKKLILPNSLTTIESSAFYYCNNLEEILYNGTVKEWQSKIRLSPTDSFFDCGTDTIICIDGKTKII